MKYKVLIFVSYYLPGYKAGGPIQSIANLVERLGDEFEFKIVTTDRDTGDEAPFADFPANEWTKIGKACVLYLASPTQNFWRVARIMRETQYDAVYLNSFFHKRSTILPLLVNKLTLALCKPVILAPRGEFSGGALNLKGRKKRAYISVTRALGLYRDVIWHASSIYEGEDIRTVFGDKARILVASDLPRPVGDGLTHEPRASGQPLRVVFLSRISPMKNLKFVLEVLSRVTVAVKLTIVGFIDSLDYWADCQTMVQSLPLHIRVSYDGVVPAAKVPEVLARNDLFFLPTLGENFGHVIIEALGAGTPVLISDRTPWKDFTAAGCGWIEPLNDPSPYVSHIETVFAETSQEASVRRQAAIRYARRFVEESAIVDDNRTLFQSVVSEVKK